MVIDQELKQTLVVDFLKTLLIVHLIFYKVFKNKIFVRYLNDSILGSSGNLSVNRADTLC